MRLDHAADAHFTATAALFWSGRGRRVQMPGIAGARCANPEPGRAGGLSCALADCGRSRSRNGTGAERVRVAAAAGDRRCRRLDTVSARAARGAQLAKCTRQPANRACPSALAS